MAKNPENPTQFVSQPDIEEKPFLVGLERYKAELQSYQKQYGQAANHPDNAESLYNIGNAYLDLMAYQKGLESLKKALTMYKLCDQTTYHSKIVSCLYNIGTTYYDLGKFEEGLPYLKNELKMYQEEYGEATNPDVAMRLYCIGSAYHGSGKPAEGLPYLQDALEMYQAIYGEDINDPIAMCLYCIGSAYYDSGKPAEGLPYLQDALEMYQAIYGEDITCPYLVIILDTIASVYCSLGDKVQALKFASLAYKISDKVPGLNGCTKNLEQKVAQLVPEVFISSTLINSSEEIKEIIDILGPAPIARATGFPPENPFITVIKMDCKLPDAQEVLGGDEGND